MFQFAPLEPHATSRQNVEKEPKELTKSNRNVSVLARLYESPVDPDSTRPTLKDFKYNFLFSYFFFLVTMVSSRANANIFI